MFPVYEAVWCMMVRSLHEGFYYVFIYLFIYRKTLMKSFIDSQFNYCPLIWIQHTRSLNNKINKLQEGSLRIVYEDYMITY